MSVSFWILIYKGVLWKPVRCHMGPMGLYKAHHKHAYTLISNMFRSVSFGLLIFSGPYGNLWGATWAPWGCTRHTINMLICCVKDQVNICIYLDIDL